MINTCCLVKTVSVVNITVAASSSAQQLHLDIAHGFHVLRTIAPPPPPPPNPKCIAHHCTGQWS